MIRILGVVDFLRLIEVLDLFGFCLIGFDRDVSQVRFLVRMITQNGFISVITLLF